MVRDPAHSLSPLRQASYILKCISAGRTRKQIVEEFGGDERLVLIWINYLMERNYLNVSGVTMEGCTFLRNLDSGARQIIDIDAESHVLFRNIRIKDLSE